MALDANRLRIALRGALSGLPGVGAGQNHDGSALDQHCGAFATTILAEITGHAVVTSSVPGTGLAAPNGAVTGTATGTGNVA